MRSTYEGKIRIGAATYTRFAKELVTGPVALLALSRTIIAAAARNPTPESPLAQLAER